MTVSLCEAKQARLRGKAERSSKEELATLVIYLFAETEQDYVVFRWKI